MRRVRRVKVSNQFWSREDEKWWVGREGGCESVSLFSDGVMKENSISSGAWISRRRRPMVDIESLFRFRARDCSCVSRLNCEKARGPFWFCGCRFALPLLLDHPSSSSSLVVARSDLSVLRSLHFPYRPLIVAERLNSFNSLDRPLHGILLHSGKHQSTTITLLSPSVHRMVFLRTQSKINKRFLILVLFVF